MPRFRKKPIEIKAIQFDGNIRSLDEFPLPIVSNWISGKDDLGPYILIPTLEGDMRASLNDYIIQGIQGEYYPCKPDIFKETYEEVN